MDNPNSEASVSQANAMIEQKLGYMQLKFTSSTSPKEQPEIQKLSSLEICMRLKEGHKAFMDNLNIIVENKAETHTRSIYYNNFLTCILVALFEINNKPPKSPLYMKLQKEKLIYLIEQIKSHHLTRLETHYTYLKYTYATVIEDASKIIDSISDVRPELQEIISTTESTLFRANVFLSLKTNEYDFIKAVRFDEFHAKIKYYIEHLPFEDYDNQIELQIAYPQLISLKQQISEIGSDFFHQKLIKNYLQ